MKTYILNIVLVNEESMNTLVCSYKEAQLYQERLPGSVVGNDKYWFFIRAKKSKLHPHGIHDGLGCIALSKEEAIKKFKEKIDKHIYAQETGENLDDLLEMEDYQWENTGLLQWESDKAFDGGGDYDEID